MDVDIEELLGADVAGGGLMGLGLSLGSLSGGGGSLAGGLGGRRGGRQQLGGGEVRTWSVCMQHCSGCAVPACVVPAAAASSGNLGSHACCC